MNYAFRNERYFPKDKIYNNNSLSPNMRNNYNLKSIFDNYYDPYNPNNITTPENAKLSYNINKRKTPINSNFLNKYNQLQNPSINNSYLGKLPYINPNFSNRINNNYYRNYQIPTNDNLVFGLPLIIPKARKLKDYVFTPNNNPKMKGMKKNFSNFEERNIENEFININTPQNSSEIDLESNNIEKKKKPNFFLNKMMKKSKTEEYLNENINPFYNEEIKKNPHKKWWKLLRYFVEVYNYFSILKKYKKKINIIREKEINQKEEKLFDEIYVIRNWILRVQGSDYWKNMIKFKEINRIYK